MPSRKVTRPASARIARKSDGEPEVTLSRRGLERLRCGHGGVCRPDLRPPSELKGGEVVRLVDDRGWFVGKAYYGKQSQISVRLLTREDEPVDEAFFARRLKQAKALREAAAPDPELRGAGRVVHGEADLLPGLVVDRYADCLVMQTLIEATDARRELFARLLNDLCAPRAIVERNDVKVRAHEGLPLRKGMLRGDPPGPVEFLEGEVRLHRPRPARLRQEQVLRRSRAARIQGDQPARLPPARERRRARDQQLLLPHRRADLRADGPLRRRRRAPLRAGDRTPRRRERSPHPARRSRDALPQVPRPAGALRTCAGSSSGST